MELVGGVLGNARCVEAWIVVDLWPDRGRFERASAGKASGVCERGWSAERAWIDVDAPMGREMSRFGHRFLDPGNREGAKCLDLNTGS